MCWGAIWWWPRRLSGQEGTSREYLPVEFPAAADFRVTAALAEAAGRAGEEGPHRRGSLQGFLLWTAQPGKFSTGLPAAGAVGGLEAGRLSGIRDGVGGAVHPGGCREIRAGCVLQVLWNQEREAAGLDNPRADGTGRCPVDTAAEALRLLIAADSREERNRK